MDNNYSYILEEFKKMCPWAANLIKRWYKSDQLEITIELKDGSAMTYDYILKAYTYARSIEALIEKQTPNTREKWEKEFALRLYRKLWTKSMSQEELSYATGISQSSISNYFNGRTTPNTYCLYKMADTLKLNGDDLAHIFCLK